jgi:hypothetical protein
MDGDLESKKKKKKNFEWLSRNYVSVNNMTIQLTLTISPLWVWAVWA